MRSTTLYSTFTSWAAVMGRARDKIFLEMLPLEKSLLLPTRAASFVQYLNAWFRWHLV